MRPFVAMIVVCVTICLLVLPSNASSNRHHNRIQSGQCRQSCWLKWSGCVQSCNGKTDKECGVPCLSNKLQCEKDCDVR